MIVSLDPDSPVPLFEQLRGQLELLILSGQLAPGTRLPAIRHLAIDLGLARGTVAKVYEALGRTGLVSSSGRHGTIVSATPRPQAAAAAFADTVDGLVTMARQLGLPADEVHAAIDRAYERQHTAGTRSPD